MGDECVGDGGPGVLFANDGAGADGHRGKGTVPRFAGSVPTFYPHFMGSVPSWLRGLSPVLRRFMQGVSPEASQSHHGVLFFLLAFEDGHDENKRPDEAAIIKTITPLNR